MTKREVRCCALSHLALTAGTAADEHMGWSGQLPAGLRGPAGYDLQVGDMKLLPVLRQERQGVLVLLHGVDPALPGQQGHLDGHGASPRAHVPAHRFRRQGQVGQGTAAHFPVLTAVTLESVAEMERLVKEFHFADTDITCLNVSCARELGAYHLMTAQNPGLGSSPGPAS